MLDCAGMIFFFLVKWKILRCLIPDKTGRFIISLIFLKYDTLKACILVHFEMGIIGFLLYFSQNFPC